MREKQIRKLEQQADKIEKWLSENKKKIGANRKELTSIWPSVVKKKTTPIDRKHKNKE